MTRVLAVVGAMLVIVASVSPALAGGKPEKADAESPPPQFFAAGELCDFAVRIDTSDTSHSLTFPPSEDGTQRVLFGGRIVIQVTNLDSGDWRVYNTSGPAKFVFGDTLRISGTGPWLIYFLEGDADGPGIWYTRGRLSIVVDLETGQVLSADRPHNAIDVCEQLGGHAA